MVFVIFWKWKLVRVWPNLPIFWNWASKNIADRQECVRFRKLKTIARSLHPTALQSLIWHNLFGQNTAKCFSRFLPHPPPTLPPHLPNLLQVKEEWGGGEEGWLRVELQYWIWHIRVERSSTFCEFWKWVHNCRSGVKLAQCCEAENKFFNSSFDSTFCLILVPALASAPALYSTVLYTVCTVLPL